MKPRIPVLAAGAALLALSSANASAHTDVSIGLQFGYPAYVESRPVYYEEYYYDPAPVYYYERRPYSRTYVYEPRYEVRYYERHDHGRHRGHHKHYR